MNLDSGTREGILRSPATFAALGRVERERIILPLQRLRLFDGLYRASAWCLRVATLSQLLL